MIFTTVEEEILSALEHRGLEAEIEKRLASIMEVTHLTALKDRSPHNLSGGQKQRVALAATLALGNEILILDEPTSELDEHATRRIVEILDDLKQHGKDHPPHRTQVPPFPGYGRYPHRDGKRRISHRETGGCPDGRADPQNSYPGFYRHPKTRAIPIPAPGIRVLPDPVIAIVRTSPSRTRISRPSMMSTSGYTAGEFVAVVGENGSGKTTLVKQFNNLLTPTTGDVGILGKNTRDCTITESCP